MSLLLSDALGQYEEGLGLFRKGRREQGLRSFSEARKKLRQVQLIFPINEAAGLLELRIDQAANPAAFNQAFRRRLAEAIAGTREGSPRAFRDLQNLAALNPRYPGMGAILEQAEMDMGYRFPLPDPQAQARSGELTGSARRILQDHNRGQYPVALEQLNHALSLNPGNTQALVLRDRLQIALGGPGSVILDSAAEGDYRQAVQALHQGNPLIALAILENLLRNPRYHYSARLEDLRRRIEAAL
jgi:tetratricopeptide (TPR) repeat protein